MKIVRYDEPDFEATISLLETRGEMVPEGVMETVFEIVGDVRRRGDEAVAEYTLRFDDLDLTSAGMELDLDELDRALEEIPADDREIIEAAAGSIREFHQRQLDESWIYEPSPGIKLGQKVTPIERVGLYVPGGTAAYPSSVLMNAIPARVAGVDQLIMVVPAPGARSTGQSSRPRQWPVSTESSLSGEPRLLPPWHTGPGLYPGWTRSWVRATSTWPWPKRSCSVMWILI